MEAEAARRLAVILHANVAGFIRLVHQNETLAHKRIQNMFHGFSESIQHNLLPCPLLPPLQYVDRDRR